MKIPLYFLFFLTRFGFLLHLRLLLLILLAQALDLIYQAEKSPSQ